MKNLAAMLAALLLSVPLAAQQIRFEANKNCTISAGAFVTQAGRGCLAIESSLSVFTDLRDALTLNMPDAGGGNVVMTCTQCSIDKGYTGCTVLGATVTVSRQSAALHRLACILTSIRAEKVLRDALAATEASTDLKADLGGGTP